MKTVTEFKKMKEEGKKISVVTCYDYWSARIIDESDIDAVLVGDSAAMVMHGFETTINAEVDMMIYHIAAVKRGLKNKFLIGDLPFLAHRKGLSFLMEVVDKFLKAGAQAVKIEGAEGHIELIEHVVKSGVPVMGHLGLTPQSVYKFGGYKLQGNGNGAVEKLIEDAKTLERAGCFSMVLELIPTVTAKRITEVVAIPTIGIGAGSQTSGQVLVLQDLLGMSKDFQPKFLRNFLNGHDLIKDALNKYNSEVKQQSYPGINESY
jgi:3-methyl-2-oxobutanoate hydroxymethyltransferase